ncbi:MAG TPA: hypothetical protein VEW46_03770 [Pyrinomonadaceae bacterium]|nr:hypothetical protein [Pyrinomonadaceae bacterium]
MRQAETTDDPAVKKTLLGVAKLYNQTALAMEAAQAAPLKAADLQ